MDDKKRKKPRRTQIVSKIDNKPPRFDTSVYLKAHYLREDAQRVTEMDRENMELLKKMNIIHRLGGRVNCWAPDMHYKSRFHDQNWKNATIMKENRIILRKIRQVASLYPAHEFLKHWKSLHQAAQRHARYPSVIPSTVCTSLNTRKRLADDSRTRCFFDVGLKGENRGLGRIVFELYDSVVPRTCENFAAFCRGINGLSYRGTPFHRIVSGYWCQGGDVTKFNGTGGTSIYGDSFDKENHELHHVTPGVLSMCDNDAGGNDSRFNLTFRRLETADGDKVVFGRAIGGLLNIYKIEEFGTKTGKPIKSVIVLNCGVLQASPTYA